jgi:hypothetical protein
MCCYSHVDESWLYRLETNLSLLKRQNLISLWHNRLIRPGTDWARAIDTHLETASIILLLISADFFADDYCYGIEMTRALEREAAGEARVIPILVHPVDWKNAPFAHLQVLPTNAQPITTWPEVDAAFTDIAASIRQLLEEPLLLTLKASHPAHDPKIDNAGFMGSTQQVAATEEKVGTHIEQIIAEKVIVVDTMHGEIHM